MVFRSSNFMQMKGTDQEKLKHEKMYDKTAGTETAVNASTCERRLTMPSRGRFLILRLPLPGPIW